ncbi:hypothetical protein BD410DRAFT_734922, partial [Rickenella mellea]
MGRASGALRQEYRSLELLDEISRLRYEGQLPAHIEGDRRNTLIKKFQDWKGQNYVPKNVHPAIQWSSKSPFELFETDKDNTSEFQSLNKCNSNPRPTKKIKLTKGSEPILQEKTTQSKKRKSDEVNERLMLDQFGFTWDSQNYSCSYDALFTILFNIWSETP